MAKENSVLRFDHREIAVIFSLFVFVSLLMFTVGILVGKGLSQAKLDVNPAAISALKLPETVATPPEDIVADAHHAAPTREKPATVAEHKAVPAPAPTAEAPKAEKKPASLELIPQKSQAKAHTGGSLREPSSMTKQVAKALDNPKIQHLLEDDPSYRRKKALDSGKIPDSSDKGLFTVQVGSYPSDKAAQERVEQLKKLGFPHAYFSAKQLGDSKKTWYRVCLGFFKDNETADVSGQLLQQRGEVKNYIVRKADTSG